jgi:hypothetical protein
MRLPPAAKAASQEDRRGLAAEDPGIERTVSLALAWLARAQDSSVSHDGGVARDYSLIKGWNTSYPETSGYIVPTLIDCARRFDDPNLRERARVMLDWLVSIQLPEGGFQGGVIGATPVVPVTFNTGQILLGLAAGVAEFGDVYRISLRRAADWLVKTQDPDGCWRQHPTPFAERGEKAYETHVSWGLLEADRMEPGRGYKEAALANVGWALARQESNGWFRDCCLSDPAQPLTHTLGYVLRGVLEAFRFSGEKSFLIAAQRTADGALSALRPDGFLPGRLDSSWQGTVSWSCLTGTVQMSHCWMMIYQMTGEQHYREAAFAGNSYVRRTLKLNGALETQGAVKGSFPISGGYCSYEYPNWAAKFFIDSNLLEQSLGHA